MEHSIAISKHQERHSKDVLEAVFAVKFEAGDGMSGHACRTSFFSCTEDISPASNAFQCVSNSIPEKISRFCSSHHP